MKLNLGRKLALATTLGLTAAAALGQPVNDSCASAIPVANHSSTPFDTTGATRDGVVPCSNFGTDVDVWFSYTAAGAEWVTVDTCASPYNPALAQSFGVRLGVFNGCGGSLVTCSDSGNCGAPYINVGYRQAQLTFTTPGAGTYLICVKGFDGSLGPGVLGVNAVTVGVPANNECSGAFPVSDGDNSIDNRGSTRDTPVACTKGGSSFAGGDVWYSYTAPDTGIRNFTITGYRRNAGQSGDTLLALYDACGGTLLACSDDADVSGLSKIYHYPVAAGTRYLIEIATWGTQTTRQGYGTLNISAPPTPQALDDCSLATPVAGQGPVPFSTAGLTDYDRQEWDCGPFLNDGWFAWTPSLSGIGVVEGCDAGGVNNANGLLLSVYGACGTVPLLCAQGPDDSPNPFCQPKMCFDVTAGQTYYVRFGVLFRWQEPTGTMYFDVRPPTAGISIPPNALAIEPGQCDDAPSADLDGGCNVTPNLFTPISLCGTYQGTASSRLEPFFASTPGFYTVDTDWYVFTLTSSDAVTIIGESEFPPSGGVKPSNCTASNVRSIPFWSRNCTGTYSLNLHTPVLAPGTYYFTVSPQQSAGTSDSSCGFNDRYWFTIQPDSGACPGACCNGTTCSVVAQGGCSGTFHGVGSTCGASENPTLCCPANFNGVGGLSVQDIFDFLGAYFSNDPRADFNHSSDISVQDIFDFLAAYFTGCA